MTAQEINDTDALAFALSQEELYVLLLYLKTPAPIELENFEAQVLESIPADYRNGCLQIVERSLTARQYLVPTPEQKLEPNPAVAQVIMACTQPEHSWIVMHRTRDQEGQAYFFHQQGELFVSHSLPLPLLHEFFVFPSHQPLQQNLLALIPADGLQATNCEGGVISQNTFQSITASGLAGKNDITQALTAEGLASATAELLTASLVNYRTLTLITRLIHPSPGAAAQPESGATIITAAQTLWVLEAQPPDKLSVRSTSPAELETLLSQLLTV